MRNLIFVFFLSLCIVNTYGQISSVEFQFANPTIDCLNNQICFDVQVKAIEAVQNDGLIELSDAQYRLFYPNNIMTFASATNALSNYGDPVVDNSGPIGSDVLNLLGPGFAGTDGIGFLDYLISLSSNTDAVALSADWMTTSVLCFNPVESVNGSNEVCTQLVWTESRTAVYTNALLAASEVEDGGGPAIVDLDETGIHYGYTVDNMDPNQDCVSHDCLLPIELVSFQAKYMSDNQVELQWETKSEINSAQFELERSIGQANNFESLSSINAVGSAFQEASYSYVDNLPFKEKTYFYRLKMVDLDGSYEYSNTISINKDSGSSKFQTYPNPTNEEINLEFEVLAEKDMVEIYVIDQLGKSTIQRLFGKELERGTYLEKFNLNLSSGQYIIQLNIGNNTEQKSIQVIK